MVAIHWAGLVGIASASAGGFLIGSSAYQQAERRRRINERLSTDSATGIESWVRWRARKGIALLRPLGEWLLCVPPAARYMASIHGCLVEKGIESTPVAATTCLGALVLLCAVGGWVVSGTPVFGLALAGCVLVAAGSYGKSCSEKRTAALRDEVPDALRSISVCFRAGLSLMQTLNQVGSEMKGPLGAVFLTAARRLETGGTAAGALTVFKQTGAPPELAFVGVALDVQHHSGGSLGPVLDAARESVEGEIELARSLRVETAQAKLSARIVTLMPFVLIALFSLMSPGFLEPFFRSFGGFLLLAVALAMQAGGVLLVQRMLNVEVN